MVTLETIARHCAGRDVLVLLGADLEVGELIATGRADAAERAGLRWREELGEGLVFAVTNHHVGYRGVTRAPGRG